MERVPAYILQVYNAYMAASDRGDEKMAGYFRRQLDSYIDRYGYAESKFPRVPVRAKVNPIRRRVAERRSLGVCRRPMLPAPRPNPAKKKPVKIKVKRRGITGLPKGAWSTWPVTKLKKHFAALAKKKGAGTAMRAVMNIERFFKNTQPQISKKAGQVIEGLKRSREYHKALKSNPQLMVISNPVKNPQLMVVSNPTAVPGVTKRQANRAEKAYKRFHFTKPARMEEREIPNGWPKAYVVIGDCLRFDVKPKSGKKVVKNFTGKNKPVVCTTAESKDVYIFGNLSGVPSGTAVRVDYKVPKTSKRNKWASEWTHDHETGPRVNVHSSGHALKISGRGLKVTPRGIEG